MLSCTLFVAAFLCSGAFIVEEEPLVRAIRIRNADLVRQLANENTVNYGGFMGQNPLVVATKVGDIPIMKILIGAGARLNPTLFGTSLSPLITACMNDREDIVKLLLDHGADINQIFDRESALGYASKKGSVKVMKYLAVEKEMDVNRKGIRDKTPLMYACTYCKDLAKFMIEERNGDMNVWDKLGETPLFYAAWDETGELASLMIEKGADLQKRANDGRTPLHAAIAKENVKMMTILLKNGVDVGIATIHGMTPLDLVSLYFELSGVDVEADILAKRKICLHGMPMLEVFLENGVKIPNLNYLMEATGVSLNPFEKFQEYYRKLVKACGQNEFVLFHGCITEAMEICESGRYNSLWYVARMSFQMARKVEIPYIYTHVIREQLFNIYYKENEPIFNNTYFSKIPMDMARFFFMNVFNPDIPWKTEKRGKAIEALFAIGNVHLVGKILNFDSTQEEIKPVLQDLILEMCP